MRALLVAIALLVPARAAQADPRLEAADALSEIGLARIAEELGDAGVAARLDAPRAGEALLAVRASPYVRAPEQLVPALAGHACGRHPTIAPEAAFALARIGELLRPSELATREVLRRDLQRAQEALGCAQRAPLPRADIAQLLAQLGAKLATLLR